MRAAAFPGASVTAFQGAASWKRLLPSEESSKTRRKACLSSSASNASSIFFSYSLTSDQNFSSIFPSGILPS